MANCNLNFVREGFSLTVELSCTMRRKTSYKTVASTENHGRNDPLEQFCSFFVHRLSRRLRGWQSYLLYCVAPAIQTAKNLSGRDLSRFSVIHQPQLQKMVQDIKKNDGSIMNRLKRFKSKPPPKVPVRDYSPDDDQEGDQWSGSEFDSDTYEDPQENNDDSYEPPPCERNKRIFPPASSAPFSKGEYIDSRDRPGESSGDRRGDRPGDRPVQPPRKPILPPERPAAVRPDNDDEDYINPEDEDDNYIDPSEKPASDAKQGAKRKEGSPSNRRGAAVRTHSPDVYEVPDPEENCPPNNRPSVHLRISAQSLPPVASPRILSKKPLPSPKPQDEDEYEVCDADESDSVDQEDVPVLPLKAPAPRPRDLKSPNPPLKPKPVINTESEAKPVPLKRDIPNATPSSSCSSLAKTRSPCLREASSPKPPVEQRSQSANKPSADEKDAGVYQKPWYAGSCDRKTAEDALTRSNKDGSFMVRKSSGQDVQQPYTLVVFYKNRVYNIPVRYIQSLHQYALGREKKGEEHFSSVCSIIENHQKKALVLIDSQNNTKDSTKLSHAVKP